MFRHTTCKHAVVLALHVIRTPTAEAKAEERPVSLKLGKVRPGFVFPALTQRAWVSGNLLKPQVFTLYPVSGGKRNERLRSYHAAGHGTIRTRHYPVAATLEPHRRHAPQPAQPEGIQRRQRVGPGLCRLFVPLLADLLPSPGDRRACEEG